MESRRAPFTNGSTPRPFLSHYFSSNEPRSPLFRVNAYTGLLLSAMLLGIICSKQTLYTTPKGPSKTQSTETKLEQQSPDLFALLGPYLNFSRDDPGQDFGSDLMQIGEDQISIPENQL